MLDGVLHSAWGLRAAGIALLAVALGGHRAAGAGLTPESPQVAAAIERAVVYLENNGSTDNRFGAHGLAGLAILKHRGDPAHPKVQEHAAVIRASLQQLQPVQIKSDTNWDIYSTGIAIVFLCELDPAAYQTEILKLLQSLQIRQKPHGGWGYPERTTGDTSMTQYGVLGTWLAAQSGFSVSPQMVEGVTRWLLLTQDPSGGYGYQGVVSASGTLVQQSEIKLSLTSAGLGSVYMCADLLGYIKEPKKKPDDGLPAALKEIQPKDGPGRGKVVSQIDRALLREATNRGNAWMAANYRVNQGSWQYYYMYALERYQSFRELAEGDPDPSPNWYNLGAEFLMQSQKQDGGWSGDNNTPVPDAAFGALFLLRSTKRTIEKAREYGTGVLVGGRGLPKETALVEVRDGQVVAKPLLGPGQALLAALEDPSGENYAKALEALDAQPAEDIHELVSRNAQKLRDLAANRSPEARLAAVQALGRSRDLRNVPTLIYALSDPDRQVMQAARDGLLRVSRRFDAFGISDDPTDAELRTGIARWKAWYRRVQPDAEFESD